MTSLEAFVESYVAVWNEPDPRRRRDAVRALWAPDAVHVLQPPEEIDRVAAAIGFAGQVLQARGHDTLDARVTRAHEEFVAPGAYVFRARGDAGRLGEVVKFRWEMVPRDGGPAAGVGLEVLLLAGDGRIAADYQFIEA